MSGERTQFDGFLTWKNIRGVILPALAIVLLGSSLFLYATEQDEQQTLFYLSAEAENKPAVVEPLDDSEFNQVVLTARAAERLDIQTVLIAEQEIDGEQRLVIPYSAVIYGLHGETWAYISPAELTYVRDPIVVEYIEGDIAVLEAGPPVGTEVVTVGVAELYGTDTGVGK